VNGGVSGIAGSFLGFNYSTTTSSAGETLSLDSQLGTRMRSVRLGFTEPYFLWTAPIQLGFMVYLTRFDFNQGREASILAGQNLIPEYNQLGAQNLLNYVQNSHGFSVSATAYCGGVSRRSTSLTASTSPT